MKRWDLDYSELLVKIGYSWVDLSDDQRGPVSGEWGLMSNAPLDLVAQTGRMSFDLINTSRKYTPGLTTTLAGWGKGLPVMIVMTYWDAPFTRWKGVIDDIEPVLGVLGEQMVRVSCVDWIDYAAKTPIVNPGILADQRSDEALAEVVDLSPIPPDNTDFGVGISTFPTIFDTVKSLTKSYSEFMKIALSEVGYIYLRKDAVFGETLTFESEHGRSGLSQLTAVPASLLHQDGGFMLLQDGGRRLINTELSTILLDNAFDISLKQDTKASYGDQIINRFSAIASPRRLDASPQILFQLDKVITISSGQTLEISGTYADPSGGSPINAQDMIAPVATTDYLMNTKSDGTGVNITADLVIVDGSYGSDGFTHLVRNDSIYTGYITQYNCRGTGIYIYNPIEHVEDDGASILQYGYQGQRLDQKYQGELTVGIRTARKVIEFYKDPRTLIESVKFYANVSDELMWAFLCGDVGYLIHVVEDQLNIDDWYHIHGVKFSLYRGVIMCEWIIKIFRSLLSAGLILLPIEFDGENGMGVNFGVLPAVYSDDTPETLTMSAWIYQTDIDSGALINMSADAGGIRLLTAYSGSPSVYHNIFDGASGNWRIAETMTFNSWNHVVMTFDISSAANDPIIYLNGLSKAVSETSTPAGSKFSKEGIPIIIGATKTATWDYQYVVDGQVADIRVYHRILTADEVLEIYNAGIGGNAIIDDDLVFQACCVRTNELADFVDQTLSESDKVLDNIFGAVGDPIGGPIGRALP